MSLTRRMIPEKLLIVPVEEKQDGLVFVPKKKTEVIEAKIIMSGKAPDGEHQPEDGDLIQCSMGGQPVNIDGVYMTLIHYSQILYFH